MDIAQANAITGGLSKPSKMPGRGFSIPAKYCKMGAKLRTLSGSVCSVCYALKGRYVFGVVKTALERRFKLLNEPLWVEAMVRLIKKQEKSGFFRWHDSGDIQSIEHLLRIVEVCKQTPNVKHWLPTREYGLVSAYLRAGHTFPKNLTVRLSAYMLNGPPPTDFANKLGVQTSGVSKDTFTCPASKQDNFCGKCRACWDSKVENISYKQH